MLGIAHSKKEAWRSAKRLADYRVKESELRAQLRRIQAAKAERSLRVAEMDFGRTRLAVRMSGYLPMCSEHTRGRRGAYPSVIGNR